jgi:hypothetical protein
MPRYLLMAVEDIGRTRAIIRERVTRVWIVSAGANRGPLIVPDDDAFA